MLLQLLAIAWLGGASTAALGGSLWLSVLAAPLAWGWRRGPCEPARSAFAVVLVAVALGASLWYRSHTPKATPNDISHFVGAGPTRIVGTVDGDSQEREQARLLRLKVVRVEDDRGYHAASGLALLRLFKATDYADGEQIEARGKLIQPKELAGLDYREYLARQGIFAEVDYPRTRRLAPAPEPGWRQVVSDVPLLPRSARARLDRAASAPCLQTTS